MSPPRPDRDLRRVDAEDRVPNEDMRAQDPEDVLPQEPSLREKIEQKIDDLQKEKKKATSKRQAKKKSRQLMRLRKIQASTLGGVASQVAGALEGAGDIKTDPTSDLSQEDEIADRARRSGEARAPVDATLSPMGDPRALEAFASAGTGSGADETGDDESVPVGGMESLVLGSTMGEDDAAAFVDLGVSDDSSSDENEWFDFGTGDDGDDLGWF